MTPKISNSRKEKLAKALRENLMKRKEFIRGIKNQNGLGKESVTSPPNQKETQITPSSQNIILILMLLGLTLTACGKVGDVSPTQPDQFPRSYPAPL